MMRTEMESFLESMPEGLQHSQAEAIYNAIKGDTRYLEEVRFGRKPEITLPAGIDTMRVRDDILLFLPSVINADKPLPLLVYLHGGGWTFGSINSCSRFCGAVASGGVIVAAVDYPLSPEHSASEIINHICETVDFAIDNAKSWGSSPTKVSVGGDSSGGNLALSVALHRPYSIESLVIFYPVTDTRAEAPYNMNYAKGYGNDMELMNAFLCSYMDKDNNDGNSPYLSPVIATDSQLRKLPPTLLVAAECDVLCEQGKILADLMMRAGGKINRVELPGTTHLFITVPGQPTAFSHSVELTIKFLTNES